jgi:FixJ family two-component response regulator
MGPKGNIAREKLASSLGALRRRAMAGMRGMSNSPSSVGRISSGSPPVIHIVDDDPSFRTAIGDLLRACDYRVVLYDSATRLLDRWPSGDEPACLVLDVQMAGFSGPQLQDQLVDLGSRLPIVFVTGHGDIATSVRAIKAGAEDFLTKPVAREQLLEAIRRALARGEQIRQKHDRVSAQR